MSDLPSETPISGCEVESSEADCYFFISINTIYMFCEMIFFLKVDVRGAYDKFPDFFLMGI